ncbi:MAG: PAS domain S-box protein, partial [Coleofasciculus sp. S288]|nr:PAS domain S-box protein [Coleofasciculus sp. S288]
MQNKQLSSKQHLKTEIIEVEQLTVAPILVEIGNPRLCPQNTQQQELLFIEIGDGLWDWNLQTNTVYFSSSWKTMLGYQESEIGDSPIEWLHRIHPDDVEKVRAELTAHFAGHTSQLKNEHRILHKDGIYRWMRSQACVGRDCEGKLSHLVGFQTDITAYRQAVADLCQGENQFRAIAEALPFPAFVATGPKGFILYVNQSYAKAPFNSPLGLSADELLGYKAVDFLYNSADQQVLENFLVKDGYISHYELPIKRADGRRIWIDLSMQPLTGRDRNLFLAYFFDITKRKNSEAELHQMLKQLKSIRHFLIEDNSDEGLPTLSRPSLTKVFRFIETNYQNPIGLKEVAQAVGYSAAYLTNLVQQETGRTVNQWIAEYRMTEARLLLLKTNQSVTQIAVAV